MHASLVFVEDGLTFRRCCPVLSRNYPLLMATWKVAPALAAGCAVVLKPSEMASVYGNALLHPHHHPFSRSMCTL